MSIADKLATVAENEQKVYEAGKTAEWSAFWDDYQTNGTRTNYARAFYQAGWTDTTFRPKYDIKPTGTVTNCFENSKITNLKECLAFNDVKFDFTMCTSVYQLFYSAAVVAVGELDISPVEGNCSGLFQACRVLETVELLTVSEKNTTYATAFNQCNVLSEIRMAGVLALDLSFQYSPLSVASMKSVISCLKNYAGTDKEYTYTLTFPAARWTALEADSTAPDGGTWQSYVQSLGWNVS